MRRPSLLLFVILLLVAFSANPQSAQTIVAPSRSINWQAGVSGAIPNRTTICATLNPGATATQINSAIATCPSGQVVKLNAGTYNLTAGIEVAGKSNITLRGAGPDQTFLKFSGTGNCIGLPADLCVMNASGINPANPGRTANWTAGYAKGATSVTLDSTAGLAVGSILMLDQLNDSNSDNGQLWQCATLNACATEGDSGLDRSGRTQVQPVIVTSISGSTVGITPGLYMPNWRSSQSPGAWWVTDLIAGVGIEDLSLDHQSSTSAFAGIFFSYAKDSWVKNIRSLNANRAHIWFYGATRSTVRDSYFYGTLNAVEQSYGIETDISSDLLVENNIFQHVTAGMPTGQAVTGSVYGYNYSIDDYYTNPNWMQSSSYHHAAGISYHLLEGNDGIGFTADAIHGTSHFMTAFRNYWLGWDVGKTAQTDAIHIYSFNRYYNIVGNVLGRSGFHDTYECSAASATTPFCAVGFSTSIFMLGFSGNETKSPGVNNDPLVRTFLMRWGNYDTVTGTARFLASEVPSGLSIYANPVPSNNVLPSSFYLSSKPVWWGSSPWPPIGPDVTGGNVSGVGGHVYKIPARLCFENVMVGSYGSGAVSFNASKCYAPAGAPAVPTNLKIIGH